MAASNAPAVRLLATALLPLPGLLPTRSGAFDTYALLTWLAVTSIPLGVLLGGSLARSGGRWRAAGLVLLAAAIWPALVLLTSASDWGARADALRQAGTNWSAPLGALPSIGMFALALGASRLLNQRTVPAAIGAALLVGLAVGLPSGMGVALAPPAATQPELGALLLDASPVSLAMEAAGVDWMRHPAVYEEAGSDWFSDRRRPFRASLAGPFALVLGCAVGWMLAALARSDGAGPERIQRPEPGAPAALAQPPRETPR